MGDSLVIGGLIEIMADSPHQPSALPGIEGTQFILDLSMNLGAPQPVVDILASLVSDGERPFGQRASNRTPVLPIAIIAPDRDTVVAARELLFTLVNQDTWLLTWTREGGQPVVFECFRAQPSDPVYDPNVEKQNVAQITITTSALPYVRSDTAETLVFASPVVTPGQPAPPAPPTPIMLDDFETLTSQYNNSWVLDTQH